MLDRKYEGSGLCLPLTKGLIEMIGGRFEITSEKGNGTSVRIIFPSKRVFSKGWAVEGVSEAKAKRWVGLNRIR